MQKIRNFILIIFLCLSHNIINAQLNEFLLMWKFSHTTDTTEQEIIGEQPWEKGEDKKQSYLDFLEMMKNKYYFNTVLLGGYHNDWIKAGFTHRAATKGLKSMLYTNNLCPQHASNEGPITDERVFGTMEHYKQYGNYDNIIGIDIQDEPSFDWPYDSFKYEPNASIYEEAKYANAIRKYDETKLRWSNLVNSKEDDYSGRPYIYTQQYMQTYINNSKPNILSFDQYPIANSPDDLLGFFRTLYIFGMKSAENSIPFFYVLTPLKNVNDRKKKITSPNYTIHGKSITEFYFVIYAALAYGAKGISYWPGFEWIDNEYENESGARLYQDFKLTFEDGTLDALAALHAKLTDPNKSDELLSLNFVSAYHVSNKSNIDPSQSDILYDFNNWNHFKNDKYAKEIFADVNNPFVEKTPSSLAVTFLRNKSGQIYFWLFNKNCGGQMQISPKLKHICRDVLNGTAYGMGMPIVLQPGEAKLLTPAANTPPITDEFNENCTNQVIHKFETANTLTIGNTNKVTIGNLAYKAFTADKIVVKSLHAQKGSIVHFKAYQDCNTKYENASRLTSLRNIEKHNPDTIAMDTLSINDRNKALKVNLTNEQPELLSTNQTVYAGEDKILLYPNPVKDMLIVELGNQADIVKQIEIYNTTGMLVDIRTVSSMEETFDTNSYPDGMYILKFICDNKLIEPFKFIVKK